MDFRERLLQWMDETNTKQIDICNAGHKKFTKAYLSMVINNKRQPNRELLETLSTMSNKSINWWINGTDAYEFLSSLKQLINFYIDKELIVDGKPINKEIGQSLYTMLDKEISQYNKDMKKEQH